MFYKWVIEASALKFFEIPGSSELANANHNSAGSSYLSLVRVMFEGVGYKVLKVLSDIKFDSEMFLEVMRSVSMRSLFNKISSTLP